MSNAALATSKQAEEDGYAMAFATLVEELHIVRRKLEELESNHRSLMHQYANWRQRAELAECRLEKFETRE